MVIAIIFNIIFPKGGFAIGNIPITWGYIIIFILILHSIIKGLTINKLNAYRFKSFLLALPFMVYFIIYLFYVNEYPSNGILISLVISFIIFPTIFLLFFDDIYYYILKNEIFFNLIIRRAILFISIYGIVLFLYKIIAGSYFEIPYLSVNIKDYGLIDQKHNNRGDGLFKLISTYNNGNIFGVCMFFLLPFTQNHKIHKILLKIAMVLTLSRTVWVGLIIYEIITHRKHVVKMLYIGFSILIILLFVLVIILKKDIFYLFDPTLNNRLNGDLFQKIHFFFYDKKFIGIVEMTYKSILEQMGILGLFLFCQFLFSPFLVLYEKARKTKTRKYSQLKIGILTYLIIAFLDGAFMFIPVSLFFWFFSSLILNESLLMKNNE
tara:strand:- start:4726 stop:5862 length:1137 start_codon:yes stop_codon:yes gene_type:complete